MSSAAPVIVCQGVDVRLGQHAVLEQVDWEVPSGAAVAVVGPNGAGKSTLLRTLLGLQPTSAGTVRVCGERPGRQPQRIGYVPQLKGIDRRFPGTARDLIATGLQSRWPWRIATSASVNAALERVGLRERGDRPLAGLSGGELQRAYLARSLVREPDLILLDEPTTGMDQPSQQDLHAILDAYRDERRATVVMVTHDWGAAQHHSSHVLVLARRVIASGLPDQALTERHLAEAFGHAGHHHHMHPGPCEHD